MNWKSFSDAKVYIDPLNVLIGTNASGKSNIIDGIAFLNSAVQGRNLQAALDGESGSFLDGSIGAIRGGAEWKLVDQIMTNGTSKEWKHI